MKLTVLTLAVAGAALAACADYSHQAASAPSYASNVSDTRPAKSCFRIQDMRNHTIGDNRTLYQKVGNRDVYKITMSGSCLAGAHSTDALIVKTPGGSGLVCDGLDLDLAISRQGFASHCIVSGVTKLTPAEVAALPPKLKP